MAKKIVRVIIHSKNEVNENNNPRKKIEVVTDHDVYTEKTLNKIKDTSVDKSNNKYTLSQQQIDTISHGIYEDEFEKYFADFKSNDGYDSNIIFNKSLKDKYIPEHCFVNLTFIFKNLKNGEFVRIKSSAVVNGLIGLYRFWGKTVKYHKYDSLIIVGNVAFVESWTEFGKNPTIENKSIILENISKIISNNPLAKEFIVDYLQNIENNICCKYDRYQNKCMTNVLTYYHKLYHTYYDYINNLNTNKLDIYEVINNILVNENTVFNIFIKYNDGVHSGTVRIDNIKTSSLPAQWSIIYTNKNLVLNKCIVDYDIDLCESDKCISDIIDANIASVILTMTRNSLIANGYADNDVSRTVCRVTDNVRNAIIDTLHKELPGIDIFYPEINKDDKIKNGHKYMGIVKYHKKEAQGNE